MKFNNLMGQVESIRNIRLLFSIFTAVLGKFVSIGATLITIPVTLKYLGVEGFGVWMAISGAVGLIGFSDFGVGMGLQNALSKSYGEMDVRSPKYYISTAFLFVLSLAVTFFTIILLLFSIFPFENVFSNVSDETLKGDALTALKLAMLIFFLSMPVSLVQRILNGIQKTYVANNVLLVGSVVSLISIFSAVYLDLGLVGLSVLYVLSPYLTLMLYGVYFFYSNPEYRPSISKVNFKYLPTILSTGLWTVIVQIIYTLKMNMPVIIVSATLGVIAVAEFSVTQKLMGLAAAVISVGLQPIWTVYGEAYAKKDAEWIASTLEKSLKTVFLVSVIATIFFYFLGSWMLGLWLGGKIVPSTDLILIFSVWMVALNLSVCFSMLLNGTNHFKNQAIFNVFFIGSGLILSFIFAENLGLVGIMVVMTLSEVVCLPMYYLECKKILLKTSKQNENI